MSKLEDNLLQLAKDHKDKQPAKTAMEQFYEQKQDVETVFPKRTPILQVGDSKICTFKNFSSIIGKAKYRKTFYTSLVVAHALQDLPKDNNKVTWYDTEQDEERISWVHKRILKMSGLPLKEFKERFNMISLRYKELKDVQAIVEESIYTLDGVGLVVIDGIRDLVSDINSPDEATIWSRKLLKWTAERDLHAICVLHTNKGDNNARGHLGSELNNKGEATISVELDEADPDKQSIVKGDFVRDPNFKPFIMRVNDDEIPEIIGEYIDPKTQKPKLPTDYTMEVHYNIVQRVFEDVDSMAVKDLKETLIYVAEQFNFTIAQSKLSSWIQHYAKHSFIRTDDPKNSSKKTYYITKRAKDWKPKISV